MSNKYTENFSIQEMMCKCAKCSDYPIAKMDLKFMRKLQNIREMFASPMKVTSGYRCKAHNEAVGGAEHSFHTMGRAVDILCTDSHSRALLFQYSIHAGCYGFGASKEFIHIDDRPFSQFRLWVY